ncbi:hypothetical protein [Micromonospora globbae]|jgi:hypothetical protein|uniref:Uncharacterized protein n=1 Tax=Micromonospora globbae TaxID=1894969 RepID=A0A420EY45_9ACTN|nr:hypothetical protein [Micromonospora globbae]RKF25620.1 hypothetical protein D7I43_19595 [Micromonospora globbae]WTF87374.1 hypothetical protein OH732_07265 [Micromonospora globbae]
MSVSLILLPLAVAAVAAAHGATAGRDEDGRVVCQVQTRMRDESLLTAALADTAAVVAADRDAITADWAGVRAVFQRGDDGIWSAHFTGDVDERRAVEIVGAVDAAYGRQVQRAVLERLRAQAPAAGLRLESEEVTEDASVRLVFAVEGRS